MNRLLELRQNQAKRHLLISLGIVIASLVILALVVMAVYATNGPSSQYNQNGCQQVGGC